MKETKRNTLTVLGCVCFALSFVLNIYNLIQYRTVGGILGLIVYLLLILALAFRNPLLIVAAGICLVVVECIGGAVTDYLVFRRLGSLVALLQGILNVVTSVLILLLGLSKRKSVPLGWCAAALLLLTAILVYFGWHIPALHGLPQQITVLKVVLSLTTVVAWIITGYLRREMPTADDAWRRLLNK